MRSLVPRVASHGLRFSEHSVNAQQAFSGERHVRVGLDARLAWNPVGTRRSRRRLYCAIGTQAIE